MNQVNSGNQDGNQNQVAQLNSLSQNLQNLESDLVSFLEIIELLSKASDNSLKKQEELRKMLSQVQNDVAVIPRDLNNLMNAYAQNMSSLNVANEEISRELQVITQRINLLEDKIDQTPISLRFDDLESLIKEELRNLNNLPSAWQSQLNELKEQKPELSEKGQTRNLREILFVTVVTAFLCSLFISSSLILYFQFNRTQIAIPSSSQK